jgi:hypothetical protein
MTFTQRRQIQRQLAEQAKPIEVRRAIDRQLASVRFSNMPDGFTELVPAGPTAFGILINAEWKGSVDVR